MANLTGKKFGGRQKGSLNKMTQSVKEALQFAFEGIGGNENLVSWAKNNETEFYKIYARLLPIETKIENTGETGLTIRIVE